MGHGPDSSGGVDETMDGRPLCAYGHVMTECICGDLQCSNEFPDGTVDPKPCPDYDPGH